jgi:transcription elongation GreA/GreB family factor
MSFYFLREDFGKLNAQIAEINSRIKQIGKEMGASCQEGAETFHDNFAYEDGERQQRMWSQLLRELIKINNNAAIINASGSTDRVDIGSCVTICDVSTGEEKTLRIGSYRVFENHGTVSYNAPIGRMLLGAEEGDVVIGEIAGQEKKFEILSID